MTLAQLRASADSGDIRQLRMMAAIDAVAALVGDDLMVIASVLFGAYIAAAHSTGQGPAMVAVTIETLQKSLAEMLLARLTVPS